MRRTLLALTCVAPLLGSCGQAGEEAFNKQYDESFMSSCVSAASAIDPFAARMTVSRAGVTSRTDGSESGFGSSATMRSPDACRRRTSVGRAPMVTATRHVSAER